MKVESLGRHGPTHLKRMDGMEDKEPLYGPWPRPEVNLIDCTQCHVFSSLSPNPSCASKYGVGPCRPKLSTFILGQRFSS
jgi:hypothetical protein